MALAGKELKGGQKIFELAENIEQYVSEVFILSNSSPRICTLVPLVSSLKALKVRTYIGYKLFV